MKRTMSLAAMLLCASIATRTPVWSQTSSQQSLSEDRSSSVDEYVEKESQRCLQETLGLTKEQMLKKFPEKEPYQPGSWRHSKDLTRFSSTLLDSGDIIEVRYRHGKVYMAREGWWRGYNFGTKDEVLYGDWIRADGSKEQNHEPKTGAQRPASSKFNPKN